MGPAPLIVLEPHTDADIVRRSLTDPERFADLFARHYRAVHRYCARRLEASVADEVAAEVFLRAFARRDEYDLGYASARPWLFAISLDLISRHRRSERRRLAAYARLDRHPQPGVDEEAVARAGASADMPAYARALAKLRPADRDLVGLIALAELSYEEAAEVLGVPVGTVRSRLSRARQQLRHHLEQERR